MILQFNLPHPELLGQMIGSNSPEKGAESSISETIEISCMCENIKK